MDNDEKVQSQHKNDPLFIKEDVVKKLLNWNDCVSAMELALVSAANLQKSTDKPFSSQTERTFTTVPDKGVLLTMPGYAGNYELNSEKHSTLSCKLVTSFARNSILNPPIPSILATILIFDENTGQLRAVVEGTEITAWRTAAVSLVATKHLFFKTQNNLNDKTLSICGTGTQGRIHTFGMLSYFPGRFSQINLWNRTKSRAQDLKNEINELFPGIKVSIHDDSRKCVKDADVIVTATNSSTPLFGADDLNKTIAHINAIGAGVHHHSEVGVDVYQSASVFIESSIGLKNELKGIEQHVNGEIGHIIDGQNRYKASGRSVFQSIGNALEDGVMANLIYQKYIKT